MLGYPKFTYDSRAAVEAGAGTGAAAAGDGARLVLTVSNGGTKTGSVGVLIDGTLAGEIKIVPTGGWRKYIPATMPLVAAAGTVDLELVFSGADTEFARLTTIAILP